MRKNSKKLVLPAIAAAGAVMGAVQMASADYVVTLATASTSASFDVYTLSVLNNAQNNSGTTITVADVTVTMTNAGQYVKVDTSQDLGDGTGAGDGVGDANLTGNINTGVFNSFTMQTVGSDAFGSAKGTFVRIGGGALTTDFESGSHDTTKAWSSDANSGVLSSAFSSLSSLDIVVSTLSGATADSKATIFANIVVPHGDQFSVLGHLATQPPGNLPQFTQNFTAAVGAPASGPIVLLSATSPGNTGSQAGGTFTPATSPTLTVTNTGPSDYIPGFIHSLTGGNAAFTAIAGFTGGDVEKFLLKLSSNAADAALVADINNNVANTTLSASLASADGTLANLGGTTWDIELTSKSGAPLGNGFFGFNFAGDSNANGITVTDVAAVPEPATAGLLLVGGLGLLARRRRSAQLA